MKPGPTSTFLNAFAVFKPFCTVTVTGAEVAALPFVSVARAAIVCDPAATAALFQLSVYGAAVTAAPVLTPSTRNWTEATPPASAAVAVSCTVPVSVAPAAGAVSETVGGVVSGHAVVDAVIVCRRETFPAASKASTPRV